MDGLGILRAHCSGKITGAATLFDHQALPAVVFAAAIRNFSVYHDSPSPSFFLHCSPENPSRGQEIFLRRRLGYWDFLGWFCWFRFHRRILAVSVLGFVVVVAEKDVIRDRGWRYYEKLGCDAVGDFSSSFPMGDLEYASLPGESYYTSDGSTESVTFPRVGDGVLGKRKIVVRCNHPTSLPKIDHALQLEQPTDPVTSSSGSFDPAIRRSCSFEVGTFEEALAEFRRSQLAQGLEEEVRNEYLAICKHTMCLPHESKTARYNYAMEGIPLMVKVLCQMRTIGIGKEGLTSVKNSLQLLEDYGFECEYLRFVFEKISSVQESFKECEKEEDELRARKVALDQRLRMLQGTL
ncbi:hypothetical protein OROMI_010457 [Orobanche minor]